jgi:hypothetical protein
MQLTMKKVLLIMFALAVACTTARAGDIDLAKAQSVARSFMSKQVANGRLKAAAAGNLKLAKAEASTINPNAVDYYIFNADKSYVVVAGDDQAPEILMYGEEGTIDINDIPPTMQWLLNKYKYQIDGLKAGTLKPNGYMPKATTAVPPMVTANWDQSAPYYNHTPTSGGRHAATGCAATSLSMCFYKWKWPKTYPAVSRVTAGLTAEALPERAADWDNIIDEYTGPTNYNYTSAQADAVAWLMRYVGQAENMDYGTSSSGALDPDILTACHTFGYTDAQLLILTELVQSGWSYGNSAQKYTDAKWNEYMLAELHAGRPIEYLAYDITSGQVSGHAFNVFGCNTSGQYYVNWGWSGDSNGYCTLHNFTTATGATGQSGAFVFKYGEAMIIGIEPPAGALGPDITVTPESLAFTGYVGETYTETFNVKGSNLTGNVTIAKSGSNVYSVTPTTITAAQAANGVDVTVTYAPTVTGNTSATLTLSSNGADSKTVALTGTAQAKTPTITTSVQSLKFSTGVGQSSSKSFTVSGKFLEGRVNLTLDDPNGVFTLSQAYINQSTLANGDKEISVTFNSVTEGDFTGTVTLTSTNAQSKTVTLTAGAHDGGTATDAYLDVTKYSTIDDAGWQSNNVTGLTSIYKYTEYPDYGEAWLTMSVYGAWTGYNYNNNPLKWIKSTQNGITDYFGAATWAASGSILGSAAYFTSGNSKFFGPTNDAIAAKTITFYVTNVTNFSILGVNNGNATTGKGGNQRTYPTTIKIYECTENADGSLTQGQQIADWSNATNNYEINLTLTNELDPEKIYQFEFGVTRAKLYEVGFCTPLPEPGTPVIVSAEPTATTADVTWTPGDNNDSWNLRYRPYVEGTTETILWDFPVNGYEEQVSGFGVNDADGDGDSWGLAYTDATQTDLCLISYSYDPDTQTALTPDNWLFTPDVTLGGTLKFKVRQGNASYLDKLGVYVYPDGDEYYYKLGDVTPTSTTFTEYTFDLSGYSGVGQIAFRHYESDDKLAILLDDIEVSYTSDQQAWNYVYDVTSPYTITGLTPETTYEVQVQGENEYYYGLWTASTIFTTLADVAELKTLAKIEENGTSGASYTVDDELIVVYGAADGDDYLLWCKDQGNASIAATYIMPGQTDFMRDPSLTGGVQASDWDQSNWVMLKFANPGTNDLRTLANAVGSNIKTGTITGRYTDNSNYTIEVKKTGDVYDLVLDDGSRYTPNVYCTANFLETNLNLTSQSTGAVDGNGMVYFFMNPKIQEVCTVTYAVWNGSMFVAPTNTGIPGAFNVDWSRNGSIPTLKEGETYEFQAIVSRPVSTASALKAEASSNFVVKPTNLTGSDNVVTAIGSICGDRQVADVYYVSPTGLTSKAPFQGVNIVVTRYTDGSVTTTKIVK